MIPCRAMVPGIFNNFHDKGGLSRIHPVNLADLLKNQCFEFNQRSCNKLDIDVCPTGSQGNIIKRVDLFESLICFIKCGGIVLNFSIHLEASPVL